MKAIFEKIIRDSVESIADGVLQELSKNEAKKTAAAAPVNSGNADRSKPQRAIPAESSTENQDEDYDENVRENQNIDRNIDRNSDPSSRLAEDLGYLDDEMSFRGYDGDLRRGARPYNRDYNQDFSPEYSVMRAPTRQEDDDSVHFRKIGMMNAYSRNLRLNIMVACAAAGLVLCMLILTSYRGNLPGEVVGIISTVSGIFGACLKDAYSFEFGSSRGSKDKDEKISATILRGLKR